MNSTQFARILVRLLAVVLAVMSAVRVVEFLFGLISAGGRINFWGFVSGALHTVIPAGGAALVIVLGETITGYLNKGNKP